MNFDVVTCGSATMDFFVESNPNKEKKFCYNLGDKVLIDKLEKFSGGGGTNTAVGFSRLGLRTGFIGTLGGDCLGKEILQELKSEKVYFLGGISKKENSGNSIIFYKKNSERTILTFPGANENLSFRNIPIFKTNWLHLTSLVGKGFKAQIKLANKLKRQGTKISYNPSSYLIRKQNISSLLKLCDVLILNKDELDLLLIKLKKKKIESLGISTIVVTNGEKEIICYNNGKFYSKIPSKTKLIEKTGAGDAFCTGFIYSLVQGKGIEKSIEFGLLESESVIKKFGAKNNLLKKGERG